MLGLPSCEAEAEAEAEVGAGAETGLYMMV